MDKIPDYRIREEDVKFTIKMKNIWWLSVEDVETENAVEMLCQTMRQHRLDKKQLYVQAAIFSKPEE